VNIRPPSHLDPSIQPARKPGIAGLFLRMITVMISIATVVAGHVYLISPAGFWYPALIGLMFPYLMTVNLILLGVWLLRRRKFVLVPVLALIGCAGRFPEYFQINAIELSRTDDETTSPAIKVMSFNVRLFDLYNWTHNTETRSSIFAFFDKEQPEILCLQEFYNSTKDFHNDKDLRAILKARYSHVEYPITLRGTDSWGIATYSAFPIINKGVLYFDEKTANICIFSDLLAHGDTVRVYNCHLQSVRFRDEDYRFFEDLGEGQEEMERLRRTGKILSRLKRAYIKRAAQAEMIASHIESCPYPVILCGDFNDPPSSYSYQTIAEKLNDSFIESGSGLGTSYAGPLPGLRIDYLLHSAAFTSYGFSTFRIQLSDHYPIMSHLVRNNAEN
jgi:endonuclease/exonuclease/phosphatase family metal-dependent hydrolase